MDATDHCWETGTYTDECICETCEHRHECSGFDDDNEDD